MELSDQPIPESLAHDLSIRRQAAGRIGIGIKHNRFWIDGLAAAVSTLWRGSGYGDRNPANRISTCAFCFLLPAFVGAADRGKVSGGRGRLVCGPDNSRVSG